MAVVPVLATFAAGLLGGLNLGTIVARRGINTLPAEMWFRAHQAEDVVFARVMPPFLIGTIALALAAAVLAGGVARWLYAACAALVLFDLLLTVTRLVPINKQVAAWRTAPPGDWAMVRDRWSRLHTVRGIAVILAALLAVIAIAGG